MRTGHGVDTFEEMEYREIGGTVSRHSELVCVEGLAALATSSKGRDEKMRSLYYRMQLTRDVLYRRQDGGFQMSTLNDLC